MFAPKCQLGIPLQRDYIRRAMTKVLVTYKGGLDGIGESQNGNR